MLTCLPEIMSVHSDTDPSSGEESRGTPKTPRLAARTTTRGHGSTTPLRKASGNKARTPGSAPARTKTKRPEPTLLGDFLLGRPSPARLRRQSLDAVKREMREANIEKIQQPGGVKDRVKQWQQANPALGSPESVAAAVEAKPDQDVIVVEIDEDQSSADEELRKRVKYRKQKQRVGRRRSRDEVHAEDAEEPRHERSKSAPRKRVVSDEHWRKNRTATPKQQQQPDKLPSDFTTTSINPPLERKIQDWVKRTDEEPVPSTLSKLAGEKGMHSRSKSQPALHAGLEHGQWPKRSGPVAPDRPNNSHEQLRKRFEKVDKVYDRARKPEDHDSRARSRSLKDDTTPLTTRAFPGPKASRPHEAKSSDGQAKDRTASNLSPLSTLDSKTRRSRADDEVTEERPHTAHGQLSSLEDVPFGNSAFSVLELPLGADAHTLRTLGRKPSKPQRAPSFRVPNILKKVYTEGVKIMHDTANPPLVPVNQPPSIESWLKNTTDPFLDDEMSSRPVEVEASPVTAEMMKSETRLPIRNHEDRTTGRQSPGRVADEPRRTSRNSSFSDIKETPRPKSAQKSRDDGQAQVPVYPDLSPLPGLRRATATRGLASPTGRPSKKIPFAEALKEAFRGESTTFSPKSSSMPMSEMEGLRSSKETGATADIDASRICRSPEPRRRHSRDLPDALHQTDLEEEDDVLPPLPLQCRRRPPTNGVHVLSTIASMETLSTLTSTATSITNGTETTLTQDSSLPTESSLSRKTSKSGLQRRLTKHSDLMSVLSLPDSAPPGRTRSIVSARSIRTSRRKLPNATVQDVMKEVADDEGKYMRELKTLVDGVIPVLLTCVLSKSKTAEAAGLFNPNATDSSDTTFTQPIVDMGVALERLKSLHRRVPLDSADAFMNWAHRAHKTYTDYINAWRLGFHDVVVNLAPASRSVSNDENSLLEGVARNEDGDVINANGERVDVAFLLKRPMIRIKYLSKATKVRSFVDILEISC